MTTQSGSRSEWCVLCCRSTPPATRELSDGCLAHPGCADDPVYAESLLMHDHDPVTDTDVQALRDYLTREGVDHSAWTDEKLSAAVKQAKTWIAGRRWSWKVVAENILCEGRPSRDG